jgi:hypothetical protein
MARRYRSRVTTSIHETAEGLWVAGLVDEETMRKFHEACLGPVRPLTAAQIRRLQEGEGAGNSGSPGATALESPPGGITAPDEGRLQGYRDRRCRRAVLIPTDRAGRV